MNLKMIQLNRITSSVAVQNRYPTEPCPPDYLKNFDDGVQLKYCWKPIDGLKLSVYGTNKYLQFAFNLDCKMGIACTNSYMKAIQSSFVSFWLNYTFTYYFTSRYLDSKNNVRWRLNKVSISHTTSPVAISTRRIT